IAQPNKTFYDTGKLDSGVRYGYIPDAAHTDGDLYVYFPKQNVLAVGDVVSGQGWPVVDWVTGGWIGGIVGGLQRLQTLADAETRIVPARGPVCSQRLRSPLHLKRRQRTLSWRRSSNTASGVTTTARRSAASALRESRRRVSASMPKFSKRPCASCAGV